MIKKLLPILPILLTALTMQPTQAYQNLIVFGDSLSDAAHSGPTQTQAPLSELGNNVWVQTEGKTGAPITSSQDEQGQLRPLWLNYITNELTLDAGGALSPARIAPELGLEPLRDNISFAFASALSGDNFVNDTDPKNPILPINAACTEAGRADDTGPACVPGLLKQIQSYLEQVNNQANPQTLFVLWAGANDLFNGLETSADSKNFIDETVENIVMAINQLTKAGATSNNILIMNLPDLAMTPAVIKLAKDDPKELQTVSDLSQLYNAKLAIKVSELTDAQLISIDELLNDILSDPNEYDINNTDGDCVADGKAPQCKAYLFFNNKHPTTLIHEEIAMRIAEDLDDQAMI